jgi:hypothetical protein
MNRNVGYLCLHLCQAPWPAIAHPCARRLRPSLDYRDIRAGLVTERSRSVLKPNPCPGSPGSLCGFLQRGMSEPRTYKLSISYMATRESVERMHISFSFRSPGYTFTFTDSFRLKKENTMNRNSNRKRIKHTYSFAYMASLTSDLIKCFRAAQLSNRAIATCILPEGKITNLKSKSRLLIVFSAGGGRHSRQPISSFLISNHMEQ